MYKPQEIFLPYKDFYELDNTIYNTSTKDNWLEVSPNKYQYNYSDFSAIVCDDNPHSRKIMLFWANPEIPHVVFYPL